MRALITSAVFLVLAAGAFGYCEEFSMGLTIGSDGGGDFKIIYDSTDPDYCSENTGADIVSEYVGSGGNVNNIIITMYGPNTERVEVSYDVEFDDIEDTDDYGVFGFFPDIDYTLTLDSNDSCEFTNSIFTDIENDNDYKEYTYTFHVNCPYTVDSTNGTETGPCSVSWNYSLYELVANGTTELTITYTAR